MSPERRKFIIWGIDRFHQKKKWGIFDTQRECLEYLNRLKTGTAGDSVRFKVVYDYECADTKDWTERVKIDLYD